MKKFLFLLIMIATIRIAVAPAQISAPLAVQRGTTAEIKISGTGQVWFHSDEIKGEVKEKEVDGQKFPVLVAAVSPEAKLAAHACKVISAGGVIGPYPIQVHAEPVINESDSPHNTPSQAEQIPFPVVVNGELSKQGELDFYTIEVQEGEELLFEVITGQGLFANHGFPFSEPDLNLYEASGSWFDPHRPNLLAATDESEVVWLPRLPAATVSIYLPRLRYRFARRGWYLVEVGNLQGQGGEGWKYQLRIARAKDAEALGRKWTPRELAHCGPAFDRPSLDWDEREWSRKIEPDWAESLWQRSFRDTSPATSEEETEKQNSPPPELTSVSEIEPNNNINQSTEAIQIPKIIEGAISTPGDVDHFKFNIESGTAALAFEVRTLQVRPPYFSPQLAILNATGEVLFNNIYRKIGGDGDDWVKSLEPKTVYTIDAPGDYYVRLNDIVPKRRGGENLTYQLLIREQIPHIGKIYAGEVGYRGRRYKEENLNLKPGGNKSLHLISDYEEGFDGEVAVTFENLPPGVEVLPLTSEEPDVSVTGQVYEFRGKIDKEHYRAQKRNIDSIMISVSSNAPITSVTDAPFIHVMATPLIGGKLGTSFLAQEIPLMVIK